MYSRNDTDAVHRAERALFDGRASESLQILKPVLRAKPINGSAYFCAGVANAKLMRFNEAVQMFGQVPLRDPKRSESCFRAGDILLLRLYRPSLAESFLRELVQSKHSAAFPQGHLAGLYGLCGLTTLARELRLEALRSTQFAEVDLVLLALGDTAAENALSLGSYIDSSPQDPLTQLAQAYHAWQQFDFASSRDFYDRALIQRSELDDAWAWLGHNLLELSDEAGFIKWNRQLNVTAEDLAETWAVRGDWSLRQKDLQGAVRCYWEAARRDPCHFRSHYQLGQTLALLGETSEAHKFQRRNQHLQELLLAAKHYSTEPTAEGALRCARASSHCDQTWEAWGWAEVVRKRFPEQSGQVRQFIRPTVDTPRVMASAQPAVQIDLSRFAIPHWVRASADSRSPRSHEAETRRQSRIRFSDDAVRAGLRFNYFHGDDIPGPGMRMFQFSGGGAAVLDYDRDGWPDLFFTQGGRWPVPEAMPPSDQLFRNHRGEQFESVTQPAGLIDADYGQGVAVGDIDADGWPDLFVANVVGNRLYHNRGDGTFDDVTPLSGVGDDAWSTSAVIADFNGDGLPDLFVVNYLAGNGLFDRICHQPNGKPRSCTPHEFDAADDQLLMNLGDGRFQDVTAEAGMIVQGGKGLGVLAADFDGTGRLSLFVSNDTTGNFFFHNRTKIPSAVPKFDESAVVTGLAFNRDGRAQACMGIAADDVDGDGRFDLLVTNYYNESLTLYQQQPNLLFVDNTAESGLLEPSRKQLGFGTQFLDADLDGWPDLVVTNGHVDDETERGIPLHMPTQFFHNQGNGRFIELSARQLGPWFEGKYLGRGLARLDWNCDGREDFVITNLESPVALLTNETPREGHFLSLQLIGTISARDPIGTTVLVETTTRTISRQLHAGDGYQASNERQLVFGVGSDQSLKIEIHWPSGQTQSFSNVVADKKWLAIEGRPLLIQLNP